MSTEQLVVTVDAHETGHPGLIAPVGTEEQWLELHVDELGPKPQVNRFEAVRRDKVEFTAVEVHDESHQLTVAADADIVVVLYAQGWAPGGPETPRVALLVPASWGIIIPPGVWHAGVIALADTPVMAAFRPRTLQEGTRVHKFGHPIGLSLPDRSDTSNG